MLLGVLLAPAGFASDPGIDAAARAIFQKMDAARPLLRSCLDQRLAFLPSRDALYAELASAHVAPDMSDPASVRAAVESMENWNQSSGSVDVDRLFRLRRRVGVDLLFDHAPSVRCMIPPGLDESVQASDALEDQITLQPFASAYSKCVEAHAGKMSAADLDIAMSRSSRLQLLGAMTLATAAEAGEPLGTTGPAGMTGKQILALVRALNVALGTEGQEFLSTAPDRMIQVVGVVQMRFVFGLLFTCEFAKESGAPCEPGKPLLDLVFNVWDRTQPRRAGVP